jgi:dienelactone hydrolase
MPKHFVLSHYATSATGGAPLSSSLTLSGAAIASYPLTQTLLNGRALQVSNEQGEGWTFIIPERSGLSGSAQRGADGSATFEALHPSPNAGERVALSVIAVPSNVGGAEQLSVWLTPQQAATVSYAHLNPDGSGGETLSQAQWDPERGLYVVSLSSLGFPNWFDLSIHNNYNRHHIVIDNHTSSAISVPLAFDGDGRSAYRITGGSPLLRDLNGEPLGAPVQISKNWHDPPAWYHLYSALQVNPGRYEFEHTFAHSKWGEAYAAAHAQLSLIGWGQNQQWDESSLGSFGESITYDPDLTLNRAMVDDVRPFLVQSVNRWDWTGNVGGASFLVYDPDGSASRPDKPLTRLKTHYQYTGPNLTNVIYAGVTRDQKISAEISTQLGRTDDLVRAYYHLRYTFHDDVPYERLALFQVASDRYADNGFTRYAYGNASEVLFDELISDHRSASYPSDEQRGIPLTGAAPWVMLYNSVHSSGSLPEHLANVAFVIRDYRAQLGDQLITTPHININRTYNGGWSQMAFELGLPNDNLPSARLVPAGSMIEATVEYLIPPADKASYYGESDYLSAMPAERFQSTQMVLTLARDNQLEVTPYVGTLTRTYPIELNAAPGATAARFVLSGGLGYTPLTIHGLARPDGWRLERFEPLESTGEGESGSWVRVDQSVKGNDFWQAYEDPSSGSYDLIFNLHNRGRHQYRLVRGEQPCVGVLIEDARVCDDVDECALNNGGCAQSCTNTEGDFECSCGPGYTLSTDGLGCDDVDECALNNGGCAQNCINTEGDFECGCVEGYTLNADGVSCDDVDECADPQLNACSDDEPCSNTEGSYVCGCAPPTCQPEGCTNPKAPNYVPEALLDDGTCFVCDEGASLTSRLTSCTWPCEDDWGACYVEPQEPHTQGPQAGLCLFYYCEMANSCEPSGAVVNDYSQERALVEALSELTAPARLLADDSSDTLVTPIAGQTLPLYFEALDYQGQPTRVYGYLGLPEGASASTPVPGVVLVHGGGGTAFDTWVERWVERGYAALAIAVEGQTNTVATQAERDAGQAVGQWLKHSAAGPARVGVYGDSALPITEQWMYHASADTLLAHALLASLPEVNADQVGVMGISWGGVIVATVMGLSDSLAFAIPVYGAGHKYDIPNYFGDALEGNELYREVWDPINWVERAQAPALWLTWLEEDNFSLDSQAATYHRVARGRQVAIVPEMGHSHAAAWERPEPYDFADEVFLLRGLVDDPLWAQQREVRIEGGVAEVVFSSLRPLTSAELIYSTNTGWTGEFVWNSVSATLVEGPSGVWSASAPLPSDATAWFINAHAPSSEVSRSFTYSASSLTVSSDYQEVTALTLNPQPLYSFGHPLAAERSTGVISVSFTAPSYVEVVDVLVHSESHPGAFCSPRALPWSLREPAPSEHALEVSFDNTVAGLQEGEVATATLSVLWARLDGVVEEVSLPLQVTARTAFEVVYDSSALWSSQVVYAADQVSVINGAEVTLDLDQAAAQLRVEEGALRLNTGHDLSVSSQLAVEAQGVIEVSDGVLTHEPRALVNHGHLHINGGEVSCDMTGASRELNGGGLIELSSGALSFTGGVPQNTLDLNTHMRVTGGVAALSGQVRIGLSAPAIFEVIGDSAQISMVRLNMGGTINKGTLRFVLNASSVSHIQVPGWMNLGAASLEVDGSAYQGGPTTIVLVDSNNLVGEVPTGNITLSGFDPSLSVSVVQDLALDQVRLVIE